MNWDVSKIPRVAKLCTSNSFYHAINDIYHLV